MFVKENPVRKKKKKLKENMAVTVRHSVEMASLHQQAGIKISSTVKQFKQSSSCIQTLQKPFSTKPPIDECKFKTGRPCKLTPQDKRSILRLVPKLCQSDEYFSSPRVAMEIGVADKVHGRMVKTVLNTAGYHYCRSKKETFTSY